MHHLALSLAVTAALAVVPCSAWYGSSTASPAPAASTVARTTAAAADPAPRETPDPSAADAVVLPLGVRLPDDAVLVGTPVTARYDGGHGDWRARVRLPRTSPSAALDSVESALAAQGWRVDRGSTDVFAVRRSGDRWELVQVLVDETRSDDVHGSVLDVGIGYRLA